MIVLTKCCFDAKLIQRKLARCLMWDTNIHNPQRLHNRLTTVLREAEVISLMENVSLTQVSSLNTKQEVYMQPSLEEFLLNWIRWHHKKLTCVLTQHHLAYLRVCLFFWN